VEVVLHNRLTEIRTAHALLDEIALHQGMSAKVAADLHVALEECLTNIIHYGYPNQEAGRIAVRFQLTPNELRIEIEDDARPFNPLLVPPVKINQPLENRPIGGLGIHMIRKLTDNLRYERRANRNLLVMVKRLAAT
jgi:anti-sigma regulatory factor (Ser/Thr protein kinase)